MNPCTTSSPEGYLATGPDTDPVRHDLTAEATAETAYLTRRRDELGT